MTQYARPDSDVSDGSFLNASGNNTNLYQSIDESTASDSDYVISTDSGYSADNMTCLLYTSDAADDSLV